MQPIVTEYIGRGLLATGPQDEVIAMRVAMAEQDGQPVYRDWDDDDGYAWPEPSQRLKDAMARYQKALKYGWITDGVEEQKQMVELPELEIQRGNKFYRLVSYSDDGYGGKKAVYGLIGDEESLRSTEPDTVKFTPEERLYTYGELTRDISEARANQRTFDESYYTSKTDQAYKDWEKSHRNKRVWFTFIVAAFILTTYAIYHNQPQVLAGAFILLGIAATIRFIWWLITGLL